MNLMERLALRQLQEGPHSATLLGQALIARDGVPLPTPIEVACWANVVPFPQRKEAAPV